MKILQHILNALVGWIAGLLITVGFAFLWLKIIPEIDRVGQGRGFWTILSLILLVVSPAAIAGGVIGGRLPKEGGRINQMLYATIFGLLFPLPFACFIFWYIQW
jgi:hypothetical protein